MSFPTVTGWYYLRWGSAPGASPDTSTGAWSGYITALGGCAAPPQCGQGGGQSPCCGIGFSVATIGQDEVPLYFDADSKRIGVGVEPGIPPGVDNYLWLIPFQKTRCPQIGLDQFDFVPHDLASSWFINSQGGLTDGIATFYQVYSALMMDCTGGPVMSFPTFAPAQGQNDMTPQKSGWYYLRPQQSNQYLGLRNNQLFLTTKAAEEVMFFYDVVSQQWGVQLPQPFAPDLSASFPQWINPTNYTSCNDATGLTLTSRSQVSNAGWVLYADGVMRDRTHHEWFWTATGPNTPVTMYCGPLGGKSLLKLSISAVPSVGNSVMELLGQIMRPVPKGSPDDELCQGGSRGGGTQSCFYNHSPLDPNTALFPEINPNPNAVLGYSQNSGMSMNSQSAPTVYLQQPNDAMQLNSMQASICFDENCACPGESPQTCALNPDTYCHCDAGGQDTICGLSCAPGLVPVKVGACKYQPLKGFYLSNYQCFPQRVYGVTGDQNTHSCVEYAGPNPPMGQVYSSMQACSEQWADCPVGYQRYPQLDRPGCYRKGDYQQNDNFACNNPLAGDCDCNEGHCNAPGWRSYCHGGKDGCFTKSCKSICQDVAIVPPWGYFCADSDSAYGNVWVQNKSDLPIPGPTQYANFRGDPSPQSFCLPGVTGYGN